ncbi:hypothetical protein [Treponema pedis]|uniref:hypothetical protein n=1 Tax=Treponema pedis TaxID=409322 RepID=UPI00040AB59E|nr:hypothetical protein [Treponema pedis]
MNKQFDKLFLQIEHLKWLPWIGQNYVSSKAKLMVLGESHYLCKGDSQESYGEEFTREFIKMHRSGEEETNVIRNFEKTILNKDTDEDLSKTERCAITDSIVYQVIVQRLLESNDERPSADDFKNGWKIIFETMKVLKPNTVISLGVKSSNFLARLKYDGFIVKKEKWADEKINRAYPRYFKIELDGESIDIIFLRHTSGTMGGYYPLEWHKFVKKYFDIASYYGRNKKLF